MFHTLDKYDKTRAKRADDEKEIEEERKERKTEEMRKIRVGWWEQQRVRRRKFIKKHV